MAKMGPPTREQRIKNAVENKLYELLRKPKEGQEKKETPKEEIIALSLAIKYLAVSVKLDERGWGSDIAALEEAGYDDEAGSAEDLLDDESKNDI
jgi:hypothetical protein